ncbi:MAG: ThuA domain-containing protein, partial [Chthoniobacterales bacterium]
ELVGGVFVEHPAASTTNGSVEYVFPFSVLRTQSRHPSTEGVEPFGVHDEFYIERHSSGIDVHMVAIDRGVAHPVVWTREHGNGRVARITLGHDTRTWNLPAYRRLVTQAVGWLVTSSRPS